MVKFILYKNKDAEKIKIFYIIFFFEEENLNHYIIDFLYFSLNRINKMKKYIRLKLWLEKLFMH